MVLSSWTALSSGWPAGGYDRVRTFPELAARLATRYTVVAARDGYRIHEKSDGP